MTTTWTHKDHGYSGYSPTTEATVLDALRRHGHAILGDHGGWNHHVAGIGGGHDDALFAEAGISQVAWEESPEGLDFVGIRGRGQRASHEVAMARVLDRRVNGR